jgi:hypothetical protein
MTKTAASAQGWGISLHFRGRNVAEFSTRDGVPVFVGEDPVCSLVVPGLGDRMALLQGEHLLHVPGLTGVVHRRESGGVSEPLSTATTLVPGERAELRFVDHPEITLELRRQTFERLPFSTRINLRELARQLVLGAGLVAGMILLVRSDKPVNTLEVKGEPDADDDSALVRAMFATHVEVLPTVDLRWLPPPPQPALQSAAAEALIEPGTAALEAPPPPVAVPVPDAPVRVRKRGRGEVDATAILSAIEPNDLAALDGTGNIFGVVGGVVDSKQVVDILEERRDDAPGLALVGGGATGDGIFGIGSRIESPTVRDLVEDPTAVAALEAAVVDLDDSFVEDPMGPGAGDPVAELPPPTLPGVNSHHREGASATRGSVDGLAAVAPEAACDDPTVEKKRQLDVVFVIDVSTTMGFLLDRIEKQLDQVDREARALGLDTRYGLVVFVDDVQLGNHGQPYADLSAVQKELAHWQAFTSGNRQINSAAANLDWPENSLDALHTAVTGFAWRPAATTLRTIVHATDDDFGEAPSVQSGQPIAHSYIEVAEALRAAEIRMFSFAAKIGGQCECLDVRPGFFTRHQGRPSLPDTTGGAAFDIDEVASGKLAFAAAVGGAIKSGVCTRYPLSPFSKSPASPTQ